MIGWFNMFRDSGWRPMATLELACLLKYGEAPYKRDADSANRLLRLIWAERNNFYIGRQIWMAAASVATVLAVIGWAV